MQSKITWVFTFQITKGIICQFIRFTVATLEKLTPIEKAIRILGSQKKLADAACCTQASVSRWLTGDRRISAESAVAIEIATGGKVARSELRPDLWPTSTKDKFVLRRRKIRVG